MANQITNFYGAGLFALVFAGVVSGCGGSGGSDGSGGSTRPGDDSANALTGVFSDSAVAGVSYATSPGGHEGLTNGAGEFDYEEGDVVTFSIGGIVFPQVMAKGTVTPLDMAPEPGNADLNTPEVVNILRLLQTLDEDGDPENGITITEVTSEELSHIEMADFSEANFEALASDALANLTRTVELVSKEDATDHFEHSLKSALLGSWIYEEGEGERNVLTFFAGDRYVVAHSHDDGDQQRAGTAEYGRYHWDPATNAFTVTQVIRQTDGSGGIEDGFSSSVLKLGDETLTFETEIESAEFVRVETNSRGLEGAWRFREAQPGDIESSNLLTFLNDTDYVFVHVFNSAAYPGEPVASISSEWGSYSWAEDNTFTVGEPDVETDGDAGLYDKNEDDPMRLSIADHGELALSEIGSIGVEAWARVGRFQVPVNNEIAGVTSLPVRRVYGRFAENEDMAFSINVPVERGEVIDVVLSADGGGTSAEDTIDNWHVSDSGVLHVMEFDADSTAEWTYTPIAGQSGDSVFVTQSEMGISFISGLNLNRDLVFREGDLKRIYNVFETEYESGTAETVEMAFDLRTGRFTASSGTETETGGFSLEKAGRVIKMRFDGASHTDFLIHDGYDPNGYYRACWIDVEEVETAESAVEYANSYPSDFCGEYLALDPESAAAAAAVIVSP